MKLLKRFPGSRIIFEGFRNRSLEIRPILKLVDAQESEQGIEIVDVVLSVDEIHVSLGARPKART